MHDRESETLARGTELAVYQCGHGLLHLRVNRVTLTLNPEEFSRLATLVGDAPSPPWYSGGREHLPDALTAADEPMLPCSAANLHFALSVAG